jgi:hypothetical protein
MWNGDRGFGTPGRDKYPRGGKAVSTVKKSAASIVQPSVRRNVRQDIPPRVPMGPRLACRSHARTVVADTASASPLSRLRFVDSPRGDSPVPAFAPIRGVAGRAAGDRAAMEMSMAWPPRADATSAVSAVRRPATATVCARAVDSWPRAGGVRPTLSAGALPRLTIASSCRSTTIASSLKPSLFWYTFYT